MTSIFSFVLPMKTPAKKQQQKKQQQQQQKNSRISNIYTVKLQWLEHLWDHECLF